MLVYFFCKNNFTRNDFEGKLIEDLFRNGLDLWSDRTQLSLGADIITDNLDDKFGDTDAAVIVVKGKLDEELSEVISNIVKYKTIKIFFILNSNSVSQTPFQEWLESQRINISESYYEIHSSNRSLNDITIDIGLKLSKNEALESDKVSTGIAFLDFLLGGGFNKGSSVNLIGPKGSGKTTLGVLFQKSALENGMGCLYITYSEAPMKIINRFKSVGCDIKKYISNGKFRIYDSYSSLKGMSPSDVNRSVGEDFFEAIIRVEDPYDSKSYFENQIKAIEEIGPGGINIIDAVNERFELSKKQQEGNSSYKEHFARFKAKAGDMLKSIGVHVVKSDWDNEELIKHLTRLEDGSIILDKREDPNTGNIERFLKISEGGIGNSNNTWYRYIITRNGIRIFRN